MLAEKLESWAKKERLEGRQEGRQETSRDIARRLIALRTLSDAQIAEATGLSETDIVAMRHDTPPEQ
ncbi:hypothetical protein SAMN05192555_10160 [Franzmannia pantelleriensis]|uniref:Transposase n=1 Tax=Franzmannia pantelleriensis TaxID=48727 RepID=A0A1G9ECA0_9GAMM|nr:hypothetical protein [Halomonas pantelleriensis]SDK73691.1 hypothetical protein SAMN05192555_10160 [Halomonas pantelleriensis]